MRQGTGNFLLFAFSHLMRVLQSGEKLARVSYLVNAKIQMVDALVVDPETRRYRWCRRCDELTVKRRVCSIVGVHVSGVGRCSVSAGFTFARERSVAMVSAAGNRHEINQQKW